MRNEKGFIPVIILVVLIAVAGIGAVFGYPYIKKAVETKLGTNPAPTPNSGNSSGVSDLSDTPMPTSSAKPTATSKTLIKTPTPKPTASSNNTTSTSCNYDLSSATGAIQLVIQPQTGNVTSSTYGDIYATSGCKVLDGRSTDHIGKYGSPGSSPTIIFSSVPPGTYTAKISWAGNSSGTQSVTITSGKSSYLYFSVAGDTAPTPTPDQRPVCTTPVVLPSSSGSAPFTVNLYIGASGSSTDVKYIMWDFTGDGTYDYTIDYGNPYQYTYQNPGTYTLKGSICKTGGTLCSDPCQTTITVN